MKKTIATVSLVVGLICVALQGCDQEPVKPSAKKEVQGKPLMSVANDADNKDNAQKGKAGDQPKAKDSGRSPTKDGDVGLANAKALKDPTVAPTFVDPNNPDFIPPDRQRAMTFDPADLVRIRIDGEQKNSEKPDPIWSLASYVPGLGRPANAVDDFLSGYVELPFMVIAGYDYPTNLFVDAKPKEGEPAKPKPEIPHKIKALNMRNVAIKGYMMPIDFEDGGTNEFILSRVIPSCFYCQPPQLNDWVEVRVKGGKRVDYYPDSPIIVFGRFEVGEMLEDGFVVNLYRVEATKVEEVVEP